MRNKRIAGLAASVILTSIKGGQGGGNCSIIRSTLKRGDESECIIMQRFFHERRKKKRKKESRKEEIRLSNLMIWG